MEKRGKRGGGRKKGEGEGVMQVAGFSSGNFIYLFIFYHLPFGWLRIKIFHPMVEVERNDTIEFSYFPYMK